MIHSIMFVIDSPSIISLMLSTSFCDRQINWRTLRPIDGLLQDTFLFHVKPLESCLPPDEEYTTTGRVNESYCLGS
jgi:hypothetical protein